MGGACGVAEILVLQRDPVSMFFGKTDNLPFPFINERTPLPWLTAAAGFLDGPFGVCFHLVDSRSYDGNLPKWNVSGTPPWEAFPGTGEPGLRTDVLMKTRKSRLTWKTLSLCFSPCLRRNNDRFFRSSLPPVTVVSCSWRRSFSGYVL